MSDPCRTPLTTMAKAVRGISLVEIMIVVVLIGVMAATMPAILSSMINSSERVLQRATAERVADGALAQVHSIPISQINTTSIETVSVDFQDQGQTWAVNYGVQYSVTTNAIGGNNFAVINVRVFWPVNEPDNPVGEVIRGTMRAQ